MTVRLWQDNGNNYPGALMQSFQTVLSAVDAEGANITVHPSMVRAFASFSNPISVLTQVAGY